MTSERTNAYTDVPDSFLREAAREDPRITLVTWAEDLGAEVVTSAAALAKAGKRPVVTVPSFVVPDLCGRMIREVCMPKLPVLFIITPEGGPDFASGQGAGIFCLSYLCAIPDLCILSPKNAGELKEMLSFALGLGTPAAILIPHTQVWPRSTQSCTPIVMGESDTLYDEQDIALLAEGGMVGAAMEIRRALRDLGYGCSLIHMRFIKPLDEKAVIRAAADHLLLVTMEDYVRTGGMGDAVLEILADIGSEVPVLNFAFSDEYEDLGTAAERRAQAGIDPETMIRRIVTRYIGLYQVQEGGAG